MLTVVKQWYSNIAILRAKHKLVILICNNAGVTDSKEIQKSSNQWEYEIKSLPRSSWAKWGGWIQFNYANCKSSHDQVLTWAQDRSLGGRFGSRLLLLGRTRSMRRTRHTSRPRLIRKCTENQKMFLDFGCKAVVYLNKERKEDGKHTARGMDSSNLEFDPNIN